MIAFQSLTLLGLHQQPREITVNRCLPATDTCFINLFRMSNSVVRDVFKGFIPTFSAEFLHREWNAKAIENRFLWLKGLGELRARQRLDPALHTYHDETGRLQMSKKSTEIIESVHKRFGRYVITKPLSAYLQTIISRPLNGGRYFFYRPSSRGTVQPLIRAM